MLSENWGNPTYYPPFMGLFNLSPRERVVHSIIMFFIGVIITAYKNLYIFEQVLRNQPNEKISSWYILPWVFISFFLVQRIITPKILTKFKESEVSKGSFPWKSLLLETVYDITILFVLQILYLLLVILLATNIWL